MDAMDNFRSPSIKAEPRWGREDTMDRPLGNDAYRSRRSPGKLSETKRFSHTYPKSFG